MLETSTVPWRTSWSPLGTGLPQQAPVACGQGLRGAQLSLMEAPGTPAVLVKRGLCLVLAAFHGVKTAKHMEATGRAGASGLFPGLGLLV